VSADRPEERALAGLISELREQPTPELDWQRVEARLLQEPKPEATRSAWFEKRARLPALGFVALAAAAALVVGSHRAPLPAPAAVARGATELVNGDQLALGTHLTAGATPLVVEHAGRASWTLEPHGTAVLTRTGEFLTLRLESGALSARVVPTPRPETFAVEVEQTRVAVHGTEFRVERSGDRVLVSVTAGTVAVEPSGAESAPSFLLRKDSRGNFGLDGLTGSIEGNASALVAEPHAQSLRELGPRLPLSRPHVTNVASATDKTPPHDPVQASESLPEQPSISNIETGVSAAVELLSRCFRAQARSKDIAVSARTGLTLSVGPDGAIKSATFEPPLGPTVEECAVKGLRTLTFAHSVAGVTFTRILEVSR